MTMNRVGLMRLEELLGCLLVVSFTIIYSVELNLPTRAAAVSVAPRNGRHPGARPASLSKRVDLLHRISSSASSKVSIVDILHFDNHRIGFLTAKLHADNMNNDRMPSSIQTPLYSGAIVGSPNYIMKLGLGTPAKELYLQIDTGSALSWTQCRPCNLCYEQSEPIFKPSASSSYRQVPCASALCTQLSLIQSSGTCSGSNRSNCDYVITYLDGSYTTGDFALEALTVGGALASGAFPFGCGHQNQGLFSGADGLLGLSRDSLAFPEQTKAAFGQIFSYCMPPTSSSSAGYIEFGAGGGGMSTPLVTPSTSTLYVVELENIQVEGTDSLSTATTNKRMVVDSGTVITRLEKPLYEQVRDAFRQAASSLKKAPKGAGLGLFENCYRVSNTSVFPTITFKFMGGLAFTPAAQNIVISVDNKGTFCLALLPINSLLGFSILGNYQQQGTLFTFDIAHSTLCISPNAC